MKIKLKFNLAVSALFILHSAFGQGALTPPGAPAPAMKTLAQIEPRTDIQTLPTGVGGAYSITLPGSYYLSANITGAPGVSGIEIKASDVTIDLGGFALNGAGGFRGIFANGNNLQRLTVRNGKITGYTYGIDCAGFLGTNHYLTVEDVQLVGFSGTGGVGITCGNGLQVRRCQISSFNGYTGAALTAGNLAVLTDCLVQSNYAGINSGSNALFRSVISRSHANSYGFSIGLGSQMFDCQAIGNGMDGIDAGANCHFAHCLFSKNALGVSAGANTTLIDCSAIDNNSTGISALDNSLLRDCVANNNGDIGIYATTASIQNCLVISNGTRGIVAGGFVSGCSVWANQGTGIYFSGPNGKVINNQCNANGDGSDAGISVNGPACQVEGNTVNSQVGTGILVNGGYPNCVLISNKAHGNGTNYFLVPLTTSFGAINTLSGGGITNLSPYANFVY